MELEENLIWISLSCSFNFQLLACVVNSLTILYSQYWKIRLIQGINHTVY